MVVLLLSALEDHKENMSRSRVEVKSILQNITKTMADEHGYSLSYGDVLRKWHSLLQTYRKYKNEKNQSDGGMPVSWPYYDVSIYFGFIVFFYFIILERVTI